MSQANIDISAVRDAYREGGLALLPRSKPSFRHPTPQERVDTRGGTLSAFLEDGPPQLMLSLPGWGDEDRGYVVVRVPADLACPAGGSPQASSTLQGLWGVLATAPAVAAYDGVLTTYIFKAPPAPAPLPDNRVLEVVGAPDNFRIRPCTDPTHMGGVRLPTPGCLERWHQHPMRSGVPVLPETLAPLASSDLIVSPDLIVEWFDTNYEKSSDRGTTRDAVYAAFLESNRIFSSDVSAAAFGAAVHDAKEFGSKKTNKGIVWQVKRRANVPEIVPMRGVSVETISAAELAEFRQWKRTQELDPAKQRARLEQRAAAERRARNEAVTRDCFGTIEMQQELIAAGYLGLHESFETLRAREHAMYRKDEGPFRPIVLDGCNSDEGVIRFGGAGYFPSNVIRVGGEGWERTRGMTHRRRHAALVARFVDGLEWDDALARAKKI